MRAIAAHFRPRQQNLKSEVALDLLAQPLQRLTEEFFHLAAAQADHVRMLLLQPCLVVMLVADVVHQVQLVHQAARLQHLQRAIHRDPVQLRVFFFRQLEQALGIQMLAGLIDQFEQYLALAGEAHAPLLQRSLN